MTEYRLRWEIDVDAENAQEAARRALEIQRDPRSIATVFDVAERPKGPYQRIDAQVPRADEEPTGRRRWALYDFDSGDMLQPTYDSYQAAVDDLDLRLTNVIVISFPV
jgi:hypothetical protein